MKPPRFLSRFLIGYLLLHLVAATIFVTIFSRATRHQMVQNTKDKMETLALTLQAHLQELPDGLRDESATPYVLKLGRQTNFRYTVIDVDGRVLADSEKGNQDIGSHSDRPEVIQAARDQVGFADRLSTTLKQPMMYLAIAYHPSDQNLGTSQDSDVSAEPGAGFIRVAIPSAAINNSIQALQKKLWSFAVILGAITTVLMAMFTSRAMRPLNDFSHVARSIGQGNFGHRLPRSIRHDEWSELADALTQMQREIAHREEQFRETNTRTDAVLSSMIEGVLATDGKGRISISNRAAQRMLSVSAQSLLHRDLLAILRYPELHAAIKSAIDQKTTAKAEFETLDPDRRRIKARATYLASEPDQGVAIVLRDVTDLYALENMRRDFVANVSHELKTPLASIKAYAETLRLGAIYDQNKNLQFVEQIETQAEMLNLQIQDLLEIARVESGSAAFNIDRVDVSLLCKKSVESFQAQAARRNVELSFEATEEPLIATAESNGVTTIVNNLVSNAIHYTPDHGLVQVRTRRTDEWIEIEVTDNGIGISEEHQARVFERFYRVDRARSREKGGTGLGLAIVKHLTQAFKGQLDLTSQVGKGSSFRILLPAG